MKELSFKSILSYLMLYPYNYLLIKITSEPFEFPYEIYHNINKTNTHRIKNNEIKKYTKVYQVFRKLI